MRALEEDDYTHLPGRTFVRGFVRNYARLVRLDPEKVLGALPAGATAPALEAPTLQPTAPTIGELPTTDHSKPGWTRWAIPLTLAAIVAAAAVYEWLRPAGDGASGGGAGSPAVVAASPAATPGAARYGRHDRCRTRSAAGKPADANPPPAAAPGSGRAPQRLGPPHATAPAAEQAAQPSRSATTRGPRCATATGACCCRG